MNEQDVIKKAFSQLHASDDTLQKVLSQAHDSKSRTFTSKRVAILVAAVVAICSLALVVQGSVFVLLGNHVATLTPAENPGQVINDAYGNVINTQKAELFDSQGKPIEIPDMERPVANLEEAEQWIGDYISDVDAVTSVDESIFTLKNFLIDETGAGMLTWTVENPNGISYLYGGYGFITFNWGEDPFTHPSIDHYSADGRQKNMVCTFTALIRANEGGTRLELVTYFGTFDRYEIGDHFVWTVGRTPDVERKTIQITPVNHIPVKTMTTADGMKLTVSNHSITFDINSNDSFSDSKTVIHFKDGSEYCLYDEDKQIYNISGGLWRDYEDYDYDDLVFLFNRLIDTDEIVSVEMTAQIYEDIRVGDEYETVTHHHTYIFYP